MTKKYKVAVIFGSVVIALLLLIKAVASFTAQPAVGKISYTNPAVSPASNRVDMQPVPVNTPYASFTYPNAFVPSTSYKAVSPVLGNYAYVHHASFPWYISISILAVPGGDVTTSNAYQTRKLNTQQYQLSYIDTSSGRIRVMTDTSSAAFNKVAFLANPSYQATVSITTDDPGNATQLQQVLTALVSSWHWK